MITILQPKTNCIFCLPQTQYCVLDKIQSTEYGTSNPISSPYIHSTCPKLYALILVAWTSSAVSWYTKKCISKSHWGNCTQLLMTGGIGLRPLTAALFTQLPQELRKIYIITAIPYLWHNLEEALYRGFVYLGFGSCCFLLWETALYWFHGALRSLPTALLLLLKLYMCI